MRTVATAMLSVEIINISFHNCASVRVSVTNS